MRNLQQGILLLAQRAPLNPHIRVVSHAQASQHVQLVPHASHSIGPLCLSSIGPP